MLYDGPAWRRGSQSGSFLGGRPTGRPHTLSIQSVHELSAKKTGTPVLAGANIRPFPETRNPFEGFFIDFFQC